MTVKYYPHLDGLRAVAIISVLGFHFSPGRIPGGFIGVDIFFVISGFLITRLILNDLDAGIFRFIIFYKRRINRIIPALLVVLVTCVFFAYNFFIPEEFAQLGLHVAAGGAFFSNILLWRESGYFDSSSDLKPLLHLWSLSIEEQFYLAWPLLLIYFSKKASRRRYGIATVAALSFYANISSIGDDLVGTFYLPQNRIFELAFGGLVAQHLELIKKYIVDTFAWIPNLLSLFGYFLLLASIFLLDKNSPFPGYLAIIPVLGSAAILITGSSASVNRYLLSNKIFIYIGLISYPLYLWHWPLLSFFRILQGGEISQYTRIFVLALSIFLAILTYHFIELPIRYGRFSARRSLYLLAALFGLSFFSFYIYRSDGLRGRSNVAHIAHEGELGAKGYYEYLSEKFFPCLPLHIFNKSDKYNGKTTCYQSKLGKDATIAIIGDSHAEHLFVGLAEALPRENIVVYSRGYMPVISEVEYGKIFEHVISKSTIKKVILSARWSEKITQYNNENTKEALLSTIKRLESVNKKVFLINDVPSFSFEANECKYADRPFLLNRCMQDRGRLLDYSDIFSDMEKETKLSFINTRLFFCLEKYCSMAINGNLLFRDNNHLNISGSRYVGQKIVGEMNKYSAEN